MIDYVLNFIISLSMYEIYESLSSFWKNSEKNMIMNKTYNYFGPTITPSNFWREKKIKIIKEGSTDMHIEEK